MDKVRYIVIAVFLISQVCISAQDIIHVNENTGQSSYQFSQVRKMTFEGMDLVLTLKDGTVSTFDLSGINNLTFTEATGIKLDAVEMEEIGLYPNPVSDILYFDFGTNIPEQITIIDIRGNQIRKFRFSGPEGISVSDLTPGIYLLQVTLKDGISAKIFIKQ